jgi:hypothetical protein
MLLDVVVQKELGSSSPPSSSPLPWKRPDALLTRLPGRGDHAELLQQAQCIHVKPMLDALASLDRLMSMAVTVVCLPVVGNGMQLDLPCSQERTLL